MPTRSITLKTKAILQFQENAQPSFPCTGWAGTKPAARLTHPSFTDFLSVAYTPLDRAQQDFKLGLLCSKSDATLDVQYFNGQSQRLSVDSTYLKATLALGRYSPPMPAAFTKPSNPRS